jgi:hypothetical protein
MTFRKERTMAYIVGCWVPGNPGENCHTFTYNWMASKGVGGAGARVHRLDWGDAYSRIFSFAALRPARTGGSIQVRRGSVIGFFSGPNGTGVLQHTMVAKSRNQWWGANNLSCFGSNIGRHRFDVPDNYRQWHGPNNEWTYATGGRVYVMYYDPL